MLGARTEQRAGVRVEQALGVVPGGHVIRRRARRFVAARVDPRDDVVEAIADLRDPVEHVPLDATERREPVPKEAALQAPQVGLPQRHVVDEVPGALPMVRVHRLDAGLMRAGLGAQAGFEGPDRVSQRRELAHEDFFPRPG